MTGNLCQESGGMPDVEYEVDPVKIKEDDPPSVGIILFLFMRSLIVMISLLLPLDCLVFVRYLSIDIA